MSSQSFDKWQLLLIRFTKYCSTQGISLLEGVDNTTVSAFVHARGRRRGGHVVTVSVATAHARRAGLRAFFRVAIDLGLIFDDPTARLALPARIPVARRPITDSDADLLRLHALRDRPTFHAPVIALLLCGGHTAELGYLTVADVDLPHTRVWSYGTTKFTARYLTLDPWAVRVLTRHINHLERLAPTTVLTLPVCTTSVASPGRRQAAVGATASSVLTRAGLGRDGSLTPTSITAYAGVLALRASGRIEDAALVMGYRNLTAAADLIGYQWQHSTQRGHEVQR